MAKLSDAMVRTLRYLAAAGTVGRMAPAGSGRTVGALKSRWLIADTPRGYRLTASGTRALRDLDQAEHANREQAERLSRPVPASAFVEPSARNPIVMAEDMGNGCDCDQDGCRVCFPEPIADALQAADNDRPAVLRVHEAAGYVPGAGGWVKRNPEPAVPQAWVDQLLSLLDSGVRVEWDGQGWRAHPVPFTMPPARLSATVAHAIASGVVRPTTGLREPVRLVRTVSTEH